MEIEKGDNKFQIYDSLRFYLCFSECREDFLPKTKIDMKRIVQTLKCLCDPGCQRNKHNLKGDYSGICSIDVEICYGTYNPERDFLCRRD